MSPHVYRAPAKFISGGGGPLESPCQPPPLWRGLQGLALFFQCLSCVFPISTTPSPKSKRAPCNKSKTPKASVFTEEPHNVPAFPATRMAGGGVVPCGHALPPPPEIVGGQISGISIEEISLWPLEPLSAPSPPQICGGSKGPPPPNKMFISRVLLRMSSRRTWQ